MNKEEYYLDLIRIVNNDIKLGKLSNTPIDKEFWYKEALEKQIPKKPRYSGGISFYEDDSNEYCIDCDELLDNDFAYCPYCGQKIDWSVENEVL